ncbi:MAG: hypothetical protein K2N95_11055 [Lachnospiraceae bacterium]|nr:hypothetical protein [Lachnospiraceae bacterium]
MKQIILDLDKSQQRPVVMLENGLKALLDTGAYIPVWVGGERILSEALGAQLVKKHIILSATMFSHLIYEIDDWNHKFNITIPDSESNVRNLRVVDQNGKLYVLCNSNESKE